MALVDDDAREVEVEEVLDVRAGEIVAADHQVELTALEPLDDRLHVLAAAAEDLHVPVAPLDDQPRSSERRRTVSSSRFQLSVTEAGTMISAVSPSAVGLSLVMRFSIVRARRRKSPARVPVLFMMTERKAMTWIVLPRPMSSPRIAPLPS